MPRRVHGTLSSTKSSVQQQVICCQHPNFPSGCSSLPQPSGCTHQHLQPPGQQGNCVCSVPGYHTISRSPPEITGALVPHWQPCHQEEIVYIFVLPTTVFMHSLLRALQSSREQGPLELAQLLGSALGTSYSYLCHQQLQNTDVPFWEPTFISEAALILRIVVNNFHNHRANDHKRQEQTCSLRHGAVQVAG